MAELFWTVQKVDALRGLYSSGRYSAVEICLLIGAPSRSAVIGKIYRLRLDPNARSRPGRSSQTPRHRPKRTISPNSVVVMRRAPPKHHPTAAHGAESAIEISKANEPLPASRMLSMFDLPMFGMCRWPLGDPRLTGFAFCAADCSNARAYCPTHHMLSIRASGEPTPQAKV